MIPYKLLLAIIMIESGGDPKAIGDDGKAFGILQIHQAYCIDAGQYVESLGFTMTLLTPRKQQRCSRLIWLAMQLPNDLEEMLRPKT